MAPPSKFEIAAAERETIKFTLGTLADWLTQHQTTALDEAEIENALVTAKQAQTELMENHRTLILSAPNDVALDPFTAEYPALFSRAMKHSSAFYGLKLSLPVPAHPPPRRSSTTPNPSSDIRLPRLQIPQFTGTLEEWISFRDMFENAIGNNATLSDVQKLTYLKSYLTGEAARHVSSLVLCDANYTVAWSTLASRYQNDRELLFSILRRLMNQPVQSVGSAPAIRSLIDTTQACIRSLQVLSIPTDQWDAMLVFILFCKLDQPSKELWEQSLPDSSIPKLKALTDFLEQRARALAAGSSQATKPGDVKKVQAHFNQTQPRQASCALSCSNPHPLFRCPKFNAMDVQARIETVKKNSLCFNCLERGHSANACSSKFSCRTCQRRHHTMIHRRQPEGVRATPAAPQAAPIDPASTVADPSVPSHHCSQVSSTDVQPAILATACVQIQGSNGQQQLFRALLDSGSSVSLITESCAKQLHLNMKQTNTHITGVSGANAGCSTAAVSFVMKPHFKSQVSYTVNALVLSKISTKIPPAKLPVESWSHLDTIRLADPDYALPANVDLLLGSEIFWSLLKGQKIEGPPSSPFAVNSTLGWLVAGQSSQSLKEVPSFVCSVEDTFHKFWDAESIPETTARTSEELLCEDHFTTTVSRGTDGRFQVHIPWKSPRPSIGCSRAQAHQRLLQLENRFAGHKVRDLERLRKLQDTHLEYKKFMQEYEDMGHMTLLAEPELTNPSNPTAYIPHHFVLKESSTTTKLRVVFDASSKTTSGNSINDAMMTGPVLQDPLHDILLRFRKHPVAFTADIAKMYRQIKVKEEDADMQRILWRPSPTEPIREYRLNTVTYGTASAPYLAVKCLQQLAVEEQCRFPTASRVALKDFYVDDVMSGEADNKEAMKTVHELIQFSSSGGFPLRKWASNSREVMESIPLELRETTTPIPLDDGNSGTLKTLGVQWNPTTDFYNFTINLPADVPGKYTKRIILSEISMIFDPLGWLSPVIIKAKILLQDLWRTKMDWNDTLPDELQESWQELKSSLKDIEKISIPRQICPGQPIKTVLCGFSDASEKAYSAVVYSCCYYEDGTTMARMVTSKTKVAPLQHTTLPRLELCGAVLLSRLMKSATNALQIYFQEVRAYTDSTIVLAWVTSLPSRWKTYIRNRVQEIQDNCPEAKWYHVRGEENPADCASRGITPSQLAQHPLWWNGNESMKNNPDQFLPSDDVFEEVKIELSKQAINEHQVHVTVPIDPDLMIRFSSFRRLQRVTAWMYRFVRNASKSPRIQGPLTVDELSNSTEVILRLVQEEQFHEEISYLKNKRSLPNKSKLLSLNPFLDASGILRVGGRLKNARIATDRKHPILLPQHHHVTKIVIRDIHNQYFHAGPQLLMSILLQRYWVVRARDVIRMELKRCSICVRHAAVTMKQMMGNLPADRVNPAQPFSKCGVDYAGPFYTRPPVRSKVVLKSYLAIFVCFVTRALHIEVVESLSTESFMAAFRRFMARRGRPTDIYSDCGTNFVGANRVIKEILSLQNCQLHNDRMSEMCAADGIRWRYSPSGSPHFGGIWEAGVRSVKYHLTRIAGQTRYTYEQLLTLVNQIEGILNSRPLIPASADPSDLQVLTPAHFLNGAPLTSLPEPDLTDLNEGRLNQWQLIQKQKQSFWTRWSREFITRLQQRPKWMKISPDIQVHDMVIIKEDNLPPIKWRLGRVVAVHPGNDGLIRVATVKTTTGEVKRCIQKLCRLPAEEAYSNE